MTNNRTTNNVHRVAKQIKTRFYLLGPAFVAAIGYIDPGNFATNIQAGSSFGYRLLWVVIWANIMAMLIQLLSAKLGIATGKNLAEQIRDHLPRCVVWAYWIQAEIIAMATDLAEFIGAAIGFKMLLEVSLLIGAIITGIFTLLILMLQNYGRKPLEVVIGSLLLFVAVAYIVELFYSRPVLKEVVHGMIWPTILNGEEIFMAAGVLGATIMPQVIYLHSSLTQNITKGSRVEQYQCTKLDVTIAMTIAGFVNLAMMTTAAAAFHFNGYSRIANLDEAYLTLTPLLNHAAATVFGLSLIAAGMSSAVVGTMAGQVVMQGFVHFYIPLLLRRVITILPSLVVIILGLDPAYILVMSQVLLSFGIALALVPLLIFTGNRQIMKELVNKPIVNIIGWIIVIIVVTLNICLLISTVTIRH